LEYVHTYSLIHDDLPAMDDDDLRRGRPTNHKVFGEGHAILAGDALLTEAFGVLASADLDPVKRAEAITLLAEGAGWRGMAGGQALDLEGEAGAKTHRLAQRDGPQGEAQGGSASTRAASGKAFQEERRSGGGPSVGEARAKTHQLAKRDGPKGEAQGGSASTRAASGKALQEERLSGGGPSVGEKIDSYDLNHLRLIHRLKTGALLRASLEIGAVLGGAAPEERSALRAYGEAIGLAFQIQDDILDATATDAELGKRAGKDAGRGKITYPSLLGLDGARKALSEATETALCHLASLPNRNSLAAWARYLAQRAR
jgi:geranylgeranyl pyrophosphate synthase